MKKKLAAVSAALAMAIALAACGEGAETTLTGMVVSVDGATISLVEMDPGNMGSKDFAGGLYVLYLKGETHRESLLLGYAGAFPGINPQTPGTGT